MPTAPFFRTSPSQPRRQRVMLAWALLALGLAGCGQNSVVETSDGVLAIGEFEESTIETRTLALAGRTLVLESENGAVTLTGGGDQVSLSFNIRARGNTRADARAQLDKLVLEELGDEITYRFDVQPNKNELTNVDITGNVPRGAELRLILRSGNVTLTNLDGRIDVLLENGDINYLGGSPSVNLTTRNGDVSADFYRLGTGDQVGLATTNGNVSLGLSATSAARVSASTRAGSVRTNGFVFGNPKLAVRGAGARFSGDVATAGASVNMKTQNGDLMYRGNALTPPPAASPTGEPLVNPADSTVTRSDSTDAVEGAATETDGVSPTDPKSIRRVDSIETVDRSGLTPVSKDTTGAVVQQ